MQHLNKTKTGLIVGSFLGLWHMTWCLVVLMGLAQPLLDWVFRLHFLSNPYYVSHFRMSTAVLLVALTSACGYVFGWMLAFLWNAFHKKAALS